MILSFAGNFLDILVVTVFITFDIFALVLLKKPPYKCSLSAALAATRLSLESRSRLFILLFWSFSVLESLSENKIVHLFGNDVLPEWVKNLDLNVKFVRHTINSLFVENSEHKQFHPFTSESDWDNDNRKLILSTTERAYLEVLLDVPQKISFEHADQLMQGLTTLSPRNLQKTL